MEAWRAWIIDDRLAHSDRPQFVDSMYRTKFTFLLDELDSGNLRLAPTFAFVARPAPGGEAMSVLKRLTGYLEGELLVYFVARNSARPNRRTVGPLRLASPPHSGQTQGFPQTGLLLEFKTNIRRNRIATPRVTVPLSGRRTLAKGQKGTTMKGRTISAAAACHDCRARPPSRHLLGSCTRTSAPCSRPYTTLTTGAYQVVANDCGSVNPDN